MRKNLFPEAGSAVSGRCVVYCFPIGRKRQSVVCRDAKRRYGDWLVCTRIEVCGE